MSIDTSIDAARIKQELLKVYPSKVARKRAGQIVVNQKGDGQEVPEILSNVRTVPGIITQRGCCYAGCKGVVLGPTRDIVNITHGPIGCGFYSWLTRRNQTRPPTPDDENFMTYCFSTDMQEEQIVFGGEKKLRQAIQEAYDLFHPKAIGVFSTCPVGLIGDDVHSVAADMKEKLGINVFAFSCEGYKGVSQSAGHHIANNQLFKHVIGRDDKPLPGRFRINMLGEYNIGGDAFLIEDLLERCGITLCATFSGNSTVAAFERAHSADLNCVMCHRSINYVADMIEKKYGIPWIKVNLLSAEATAKSLRRIAQYFDDPELTERTEQVIQEEMVAVVKAQQEVRPRCEGKLAMLFVGGSRAHHYQTLFSEIRAEAARYLPVMSHCTRCRADAVGLLGERVPPEFELRLLSSAALPLNPSEDRPYVAVATLEGTLVNQHLGEAEHLAIFGRQNGAFALVETRRTPPPGGAQQRWLELADILKDCRSLLVASAGESPRAVLTSSGVKVVMMEGLIEEGLEAIYRGAEIRAPLRRQHRCGSGCAGSGSGCM